MSRGKPKEPFDPDLPSPTVPGPLATAPRSCLFHGCVVVSGLALLVMAAIGITLGVLYSRRDEVINRFTAKRPMAIPVRFLNDQAVRILNERIALFEQERDPSQPITVSLTADELNTLIARDENLRGHLAVQIVGDRIQADVSLPLEKFDLLAGILGDMRGRFLNGQAVLEPVVEENKLSIHIRELEVKGRKVPESWLGTISAGTHVRIGLGDEATRLNQPDQRRLIHRIEGITVGDGKLTLVLRPMPPRPRGAGPPDGPPPAEPDQTRDP